MKIISHRGNCEGCGYLENTPEAIDNALLRDFDVEIDIWVCDGISYLGHDAPSIRIGLDYLSARKNRLWVHTKNLDALTYFRGLNLSFNYFFHDNDDVVLTSKLDLWYHPRVKVQSGGISVMPEKKTIEDFLVATRFSTGLCTDYPITFRKHISHELCSSELLDVFEKF